MRIVRYLFALILFTPVSPLFAQGYLGAIGYTDLQNRLGVANTPNGAGVSVVQVEALEGANYASNPLLATGRPGFSMTFNGSPSPPANFSGHANFVAGVFWGNNAMANGVTRVDSWDADTWINTILYGGGSGIPITPYTPKVSNHSYLGLITGGFTAGDAENVLRHSDYFVDRAQHIMVVGVGGNGTSNEVGAFFGSGYNSIAVGRSDGMHGSGLTTLTVPGRVKPDLVAPLDSVSGATPAVAAAVTLLVQTAGTTPFADRPQTIKAVLMAGATKSQFDTASGGPWANTTTRPLDLRYGAGQLNVNNSHLILTAGRQLASADSTVASTGWDYNAVGSAANNRRYFFDVPEGQSVVTFSSVLTWHRQFQSGDPDNFTFENVDLRLYRTTATDNFVLENTALSESLSSVDNVEHIWRTSNMATGRYAIVVESNGVATTEYGVAWHFVAVPEPGTIGGMMLVLVVVVRRITRRKQTIPAA